MRLKRLSRDTHCNCYITNWPHIQKLQIQSCAVLNRLIGKLKVDKDENINWMTRLKKAHTLPCVMVSVCRLAVGYLVLYANRSMGLWCRLSWWSQFLRSLAKLWEKTSDRWCSSCQLKHSLTMLWCNSKITQLRLVQIPLPHPRRDILAASRWSCAIEKKLRLYHSKNGEDGCLHDPLGGEKSRVISKYGLQQKLREGNCKG